MGNIKVEEESKAKDDKNLVMTLDEMQFERLNQISNLGTNIYNQARALMMIYIQTLAQDKWKFTNQEVLKFEIDPDGFTVRISAEEPKA
jgi:hypothetical protein